ncbi:MAG TPA: hypothetical protein VFG39_01275 [Balneolaceae bacterium]|nr:hypothetical protein [Balneolaceae bacterium]
MEKGICFFKVGLFTVMVAVVFQACMGIKATSTGDDHIYAQPFNKMVNVVEEAVEGGGIHIEDVFRADDEKRITLIINTNTYSRGRDEVIQKGQGTVIITELAKDKVQVEVENPDYHFTVPQYMREKYDRIIYDRISAILDRSPNV